jgi:hypothetical protein
VSVIHHRDVTQETTERIRMKFGIRRSTPEVVEQIQFCYVSLRFYKLKS